MVNNRASEDEAGTRLPPEKSAEKPGRDLPADFFKKLIHQPPCKTGGECNNCGRCEH